MKNIIKKIGGLCLGVAMLSGVVISLNLNQSREVNAATATYNFSEAPGFADWGTSYSKREIQYTEGKVIFSSANHQGKGMEITDIPVTKGQPVEFIASSGNISSLTFTCRKWGSINQTITLNTSNNGGTTYTATAITSTTFVLSTTGLNNVNAVKFTFSNTSKQVGIESLSITVATGCDHVWVAGTIHAPTCTEEGYTDYVCSKCEAEKTDDVVEPLGHDWAYNLTDGLDHCQRQGCDETKEHVDAIVFDKNSCTNMSSTRGEQNQIIECITVSISDGLLNSDGTIRTYKSATLTISAPVTINKIEIACTASGEAQYGPGCFTVDTGTYTFSEKIGTWTGSSKTIVFTASTNQVRSTEIKVSVPANSFAIAFLASELCDGGNTAPSSTTWNTLASAFSSLGESDKTDMAAIVSSETGNNIEKCLARYDYIIAKYGTASYSNFMNRTVSSVNPNVVPFINGSNSTTWIIIAVSLAGLTAIGGYFFYKKRKENF